MATGSGLAWPCSRRVGARRHNYYLRRYRDYVMTNEPVITYACIELIM